MNLHTFQYPLLKEIFDVNIPLKKEAVDNVYLISCQHLLEPQEKMFELVANFGIPKQNIFILGKAYSTNTDIFLKLKEKEFHVVQPIFKIEESFDKQHKDNCENLLNRFISLIPDNAKIICLDDGGQLLEVINDYFQKLSGKEIIGIEQTSSGFNRFKNSHLHFPIINVARSSTKLVRETPFIVKLGIERVKEVFQKYFISDPRILVVGLGPIGEGMKMFLEQNNYFVVGHDIIHDGSVKIEELIQLNKINVVIGATGTTIIDEQQLLQLQKEGNGRIYFISMSSSDREFPAIYLRMGAEPNPNLHADCIYKNLVLINGGFPITFKGNRYESLPAEMEKTMALLYGSIIDSTLNNREEKGFVDVPSGIIKIIEKYE